MTLVAGMDVQGTCEARFAPLRDCFAADLASGRALGQALAVVQRGRIVVSLWGGHRDRARTRPWTEHTTSCLFSASKPLAAAPLLHLIGTGRADLEAPVARYWPAFGAGDKSGITLRQLLCHRAGVPVAESAAPGSLYDHEALIRALEVQRPLWPPGSRGCFHSFTYGLLVGELAARIAGCPFADQFRDLFTVPCRGQVAFSLTATEQVDCAEVELVPDNPLLQLLRDPDTVLGRSWAPLDWNALDTPAFRACDFPSFGAHASALGLALWYGVIANGGRWQDRTVIATPVVSEALREQWHEPDVFMGAPVRMGLGFMLANGPFPLLGTPGAFGQPGLGGVAGFGDPDLGLGVGIVCNRLDGGLENPALDRLLAALRDCL
jgi:CubicO group peptidase (beta-lactamase class C family)